jgi:hypothetical protein
VAIRTDTCRVALHSNDKNKVFLWFNDKVSELNVLDGSVAELFDAFDVVSIEFLILNNQICLASADGEVLLHNIDGGDSDVATFCEDGIETMVWSPDQEVVVFVTKK